MESHSLGRYVCEVCGKRFQCQNYLTSHRKIHDDSSIYQCKTCSKTFSSSASLAAHVKRVHKRHFLNVCSVCGKEIKSGNLSLKDHMARVHHLGNPSHICDICEKAFFSVNELKRHILKTHRGHDFKKPCPFCAVL